MLRTTDEKIRPPAFAGAFYPASKDELNAMVTRYLESAELADIPGEIIGLMAPHAGYAYSGATAAAAYKQVAGGDYQTAVVLAPSHREFFREASVYEHDAYETPLGSVSVDKELARAFVDQDEDIAFSGRGHQVLGDVAEHSLEVHIPFLQRALPEAAVVPIVISDYSPEKCVRIGEALAKAIGERKVLIIASSDLYHGDSYDECVEADSRTLSALAAFDPEGFGEGVASGDYLACGGGPVTVMLSAARALKADAVKIVFKTNSADVTGSRGGYVVGYGAAVVFRRRKG